MKIKRFVFNPFQENTFVLYDESKECVIIDSGCYDYAGLYQDANEGQSK